MDEDRNGVPRGGTDGSLTETIDERFGGYFAEGAVGAAAYLTAPGLISSLPLLDPGAMVESPGPGEAGKPGANLAAEEQDL